MSRETLTITDNRTGRQWEVPISQGTVRAIDLRQIRARDDEFGMMTYDPGFMNTASCRSAITFIDGDAGILEYRGYPIEQLAASSSHLETAYLLLEGELPSAEELVRWEGAIAREAGVERGIEALLAGFPRGAHPMAMLLSAVGSLSAFHADARAIGEAAERRRHIERLIAKMPTLAALAHRHNSGLAPIQPDASLSYAGRFLAMTLGGASGDRPDPVLERALDVLLILHADHEQNCSTSAMRVIGSSRVDPYSAMAGAVAALFGPLHGGANEAVVRMLTAIGSVERVPEFVARVKRGEGRLMGFGHRVYKNYDPRASIIKKIAYEVFEVTGRNPLLDLALELERIALEDDYFVSRRLYPNVDFYSGLIYQAMGFPLEMFPVLFAIGRTAGWLAQWDEMLRDPEQKIARPRQIYVGPSRREFVPIARRAASTNR